MYVGVFITVGNFYFLRKKNVPVAAIAVAV